MFISLKAIISRNRSGIAVSLKIFVFLKNNLLQHTAREARIASAPAALICPNDTRGKDPWSFSPRGSPFSFKTRKKHMQRQNAATKDAKNTQRKKTKRNSRNKSTHCPKSRACPPPPQKQNTLRSIYFDLNRMLAALRWGKLIVIESI